MKFLYFASTLLIIQSSFGQIGPKGDDYTTSVNKSYCTQWNYMFDENQSHQGKSKCNSDCQCDGTRKCIDGCCTGTPRTVENLSLDQSYDKCLSPIYHFDEGPKKNRCSTPCDCDGNRFCSSYGYCHGTSRYESLCWQQSLQVEVLFEKYNLNHSKECVSLIDSLFKKIIQTKQEVTIDNFCTSIVDLLADSSDCNNSFVCKFLKQQTSKSLNPPIYGACLNIINYASDFKGIQFSALQKLFQENPNQIEDFLKIAVANICQALN